MSAHLDFAREAFQYRAHHVRYVRFIAAMPRKLVCQDCGGDGGFVDPVTYDGQGPFEMCGYCEGTGYMTPHLRWLWLAHRRAEMRLHRARMAGRGDPRACWP
jgi:hypothetical protein